MCSNQQIHGALLNDDSVKLVSMRTFDVTNNPVVKVASAVHIVPLCSHIAVAQLWCLGLLRGPDASIGEPKPC